MQLTELLAEVFAGGGEVTAFEAKAAPFFDHAESFTGTIEVGVENSEDSPFHKASCARLVGF
jgi:hypothetical protein